MSLAMTAATINDNENDNITNSQSIYNSETPVNKKRQNHNKTQKRNSGQSDFNMSKVNSVLNSIHNRVDDEDDDDEYNNTYVKAKHSENFEPLNPFNPPGKPMSMGAERAKEKGLKEGLSNLVPIPSDNNELQLQELQSAYMNDAQVREYYNKLLPDFKQKRDEFNKNYYNQSQLNRQQGQNETNYYSTDSNQVLIDKLNYVINLLEENQDKRTNNVTEEVVLYSFLGVFMIFIVDSFARVGKYVR
jgi:hypothetical protein